MSVFSLTFSPHIWRRSMLFQRATRCCPSGCCFDSSQEDVWAIELTALLIHACCLLPHCWAGRISASCSPTFRIEGWDLDFQLPVQHDSSATDPGMGMGMKATEVSAVTSLALSEHHVEHMCLQDGWGQKVCWVLLRFNHVCLSRPATCGSPLCCYSRLRPGQAFKWPWPLIGHLRGLMRQLCKQCIFNSLSATWG